MVGDLGLIIKFNLVGIIFEFVFAVVILKFINNKNAKIIYNSSFIQLIICTILLIVLKDDIYKYVYFFRILISLEKVSYSMPYEMIIMGANTGKTMSNFLANVNILSALATILTPIFSGFIITKFSYNVLFILLTFEALLIILISTQIKNFYIENNKLDLKGFILKIKKHPHLKDIYKCMFYRRISTQGAITDLLPIVLFLRVGSELNIGTYNSLFAILSIMFLNVLKIINNKNITKKFYLPFAIIIFASSIALIYHPSFIILIIYYILMNTLGMVIESESCSIVYESIQVDDLNKYSREHDIVFNVYMLVGQILSYVFAYILYTHFYNVNILSIVVSVLMLFLIPSSIYLEKTERYLYKARQ